jgi:hypothetical protein
MLSELSTTTDFNKLSSKNFFSLINEKSIQKCIDLKTVQSANKIVNYIIGQKLNLAKFSLERAFSDLNLRKNSLKKNEINENEKRILLMPGKITYLSDATTIHGIDVELFTNSAIKLTKLGIGKLVFVKNEYNNQLKYGFEKIDYDSLEIESDLFLTFAMILLDFGVKIDDYKENYNTILIN